MAAAGVSWQMRHIDVRLTNQQRLRFAATVSGLMLVALAATCSACLFRGTDPARSPAEQHDTTAKINVACAQLDDDYIPIKISAHTGSGVLVGDHLIVTALHVAHCADNEIMAMVVDMGDGKTHEATLEIALPESDVARIHVADDLGHWLVPVTIGPVPKLGDRVCESAARPRWTYRCGTVQPSEGDGADGDILIDMTTEFGNSGSALYNARGQLIGIVVALEMCQGSMQCVGAASSLAAYPWLVP